MLYILFACATNDSEQSIEIFEAKDGYAGEGRKAKAAPSPSAPDELDVQMEMEEELSGGNSGLGLKGRGFGGGGLAMGSRADEVEVSIPQAELSTAVRAWFPETFVFEPYIRTDSEGQASHRFTLPDRLTTWKFLALGHDRNGNLGGANYEIRGTLPQYIDPVFPPFMRQGDKIILPILATNTEQTALKTTLSLQVSGGFINKDNIPLTIPAQGSELTEVALNAKDIGRLSIKVDLDGIDAVRDDFVVYPKGRQIQSIERGVLSAERILEWDPPEDSIQNSTTLKLALYPGALGIFRSELQRAPSRADWTNFAYTVILANQSQELFETFGLTEELESLQELTSKSSKKLFTTLMSNNLTFYPEAIEAFLSVPDNEVLKRTGVNVANLVADSQNPDGTFNPPTLGNTDPTIGSTVQSVIIQTAKHIHILETAAELIPEFKARSDRASLLANQGLQRLWPQSKDPYTASWLLLSGLGNEPLRKEWTDLIIESLVEVEGQWTFELEPHIKNAAGHNVNPLEYAALASLALKGNLNIRASLLGQIMIGYRPNSGWGNPSENRVILLALTELVQNDFPEELKITIKEDDVAIATSTFSQSQLKDLVMIQLPIDAKPDTKWTIESSPPALNVSYSATFEAYVPVVDQSEINGLSFKIDRPKTLKVNTPTDLPITISIPRLTDFTLLLELPVGVKITPDSLTKLQLSNHSNDNLELDIEQNDQSITIKGTMQKASILSLTPQVVAQFKGQLSDGTQVLMAQNTELILPSKQWTIR